jgi:hypothetical protein
MAISAHAKKTVLDLMSEMPSTLDPGRARSIAVTHADSMGGVQTSIRNWSKAADAGFQKYAEQLRSTNHPEDARLGLDDTRITDHLSPADLIWIQGLPKDPTQVPFEDATRIAMLTKQVDRYEHPSDAHLLRSVWAPIKTHHDRRKADALAHNAAIPLPDLEHDSAVVVAEYIRQETPELRQEEALLRARELVQEAKAKRASAAASIAAQADQLHAEVAEREAGRTALVKD